MRGATHPVMKKFNYMVVVAALALFGFTGCEEAAEDVDQAFDCGQICDRFQECVDEDYDTDGCFDRCEQAAEDSDDFGDHASECETCLDDRSCAESIPCTDECFGIVP